MPEEKDINLRIIPPAKYLPMAALSVAAMLVVFLAVASYNKIVETRYAGQSAQYKNTISVSGEGKVLGKPDVAQVDLSVVTQANAVDQGQKQNTEKMNKIAQAMKDMGIAEEDLKTTNYSVYPRYQYTEGRSDIIGYEITQTLRVKIKDLNKVGQILGKAAELGANQVGSLSFTFDDPEKLKTDAREKAIANAKDKAKVLAASLGVSLGKVTSFSESVAGDSVAMYDAAYGRGGAGGGAPSVQAGQNEIVVGVSIAYEIY